MRRYTRALLLASLALWGAACGEAQRPPLSDADIVDIATILKLEDTRSNTRPKLNVRIAE